VEEVWGCQYIEALSVNTKEDGGQPVQNAVGVLHHYVV
jgi:hypothetical protein